MELIGVDVLVLCFAMFAARLAATRPPRATPLAAGIAATAAFIVVQQHYKLEESPFIWALVVSCAAAFLTAFVVSRMLRQPLRAATLYALVAGALVPALFIAYIVARLTSCLSGGCDLS